MTLLSSDRWIRFLDGGIISITEIGSDKGMMIDTGNSTCRLFDTLVLTHGVARELLAEEIELNVS